jgi:hypothetical protein
MKAICPPIDLWRTPMLEPRHLIARRLIFNGKCVVEVVFVDLARTQLDRRKLL